MKWLSFNKIANWESFLYGLELFLIDSDKIINDYF